MKTHFLLAFFAFASGPLFAAEISLLNLQIYGPKVDQSIYSGAITGQLNQKNEILSFNSTIGTAKIVTPLSEVQKDQPVPLSILGIQGGTIQGFKIKNSGEGWLRLQPLAKRLSTKAPASARSIDIFVGRYGANMNWVSLTKVNQSLRILKGGAIYLDKDPSQMSIAKLLFSPPKITDIQLKVKTCNNTQDIQETLESFDVEQTMNLLGCELSKMTSGDLSNFLLALNSHPRNVRKYQMGDVSEAHSQDYVDLLKMIKGKYLDFAKPGILTETNINTLYLNWVETGELEAIQYFMELGFSIPTELYLYNEALVRLYQADASKMRIVESPEGRAILDIMREHAINKAIPLSPIVLFNQARLNESLLALEGVADDLRSHLYSDFYSLLIDAAFSEGTFVMSEDDKHEISLLFPDVFPLDGGDPADATQRMNALQDKVRNLPWKTHP